MRNIANCKRATACILFLTLSIVPSIAARAQTISAVEDRMVTYLEKIKYWRFAEGRANADSLESVNKQFLQFMKNICVAQPLTLEATYKKAEKAGLNYVTSPNKKVRFYSWNTLMGDDVQLYTDLVQYREGNNIYVSKLIDAQSKGDPGGTYKEIQERHLANHKTVYVVSFFQMGSQWNKGGGAIAYEISGNKIAETQFFITRNHQVSRIEYGYDMFSSNNTPQFVTFSKDGKAMYVPLISGNKTGGEHLTYLFDGNNYVFNKNQQ